ncbi:hypothetical protein OG401_00190 [Kitasatospora purpeofusca]|uniref:DUF6879 family protein n=1 Tax=Kitasatospora purpeofusca TaxID=67352 RepID=UPI00224FB5A7|nr:DUF6879 family protein [Kitasatospora purpeofusca]MCX4682743.1 hypothetical protein [Kitasatospora purpeofusca]
MKPSVPDFGALLRSAERSACHLEMRDSYMDDPVFADWRAGLPVDRPEAYDLPEEYTAWAGLVRETAGRGVVMRRARIVSEPVTAYIRWEHAITERHNVALGEQVRWLPRSKASDLALPGNDLWLVDERLVLFHWFTGDGEWAGHETTEDPAVVKMVTAAFEAVWDRAVPHARYTV